jgi:hypothetical protein
MRSRKWWLVVGVGSLAACVTDCSSSEYPLDPTFCDEWCRVLLRPGCDQEPENCVRNCERSIAPGECFALQETLLECYRATPANEFFCTGQGFQTSARPDESVCPSERDALIECAYPDVLECLNVCRDAETETKSDAGDAGPGTTGPSGNTCPAHDIPCDSMCWAGRQYLAESELDAGSVSALAKIVIDCAVAKADACRAGTGAEVEDANWASVLGECIDVLGL